MTGQKTDSDRTRVFRAFMLIQQESRPARSPLGFTTEQLDLRKLLTTMMTAQRIRRAGKCPACKRWRLWSYQLKMEWLLGPYHIEDDEELCGYWCGNCKWGNAGSRRVWQRRWGRGGRNERD
jgi:hypothetical protein